MAAESMAVRAGAVTVRAPCCRHWSSGTRRRVKRKPGAGRRREAVATSISATGCPGHAVRVAAAWPHTTASGTRASTARTRVRRSSAASGCTYTPGNNRANRPPASQRLRLDLRCRCSRASNIPSCAASSASRSIMPPLSGAGAEMCRRRWAAVDNAPQDLRAVEKGRPRQPRPPPASGQTRRQPPGRRVRGAFRGFACSFVPAGEPPARAGAPDKRATAGPGDVARALPGASAATSSRPSGGGSVGEWSDPARPARAAAVAPTAGAVGGSRPARRGRRRRRS
jgi:hypothetical protein